MSDRKEERKQSVDAAEARHNLFVTIGDLAALANTRGEHALAIMLTAVVRAYE